MTSILAAFDPGGTTGWSTWLLAHDEPIRLLEHGQISGGVGGFIDFARDLHADIVIAETFRLDGRTPRPDLSPVKIEGALSVLFPGWVGSPNTMKAHAPDEFLKRNGLWLRGQPHATDSVRHALAYAKVHRHAPTLARYWPARSAG